MTGALAIRQRLQRGLAEGELHLLGEALEDSPATQGLADAFPARVLRLPAADAGLVGLATGMAMGGARVVVELAEPAALTQALPLLAEAQALHGDEFPLGLVLRVPCGPDRSFLPLDAALAIPALWVLSPGQPGEAAPLLDLAIQARRPVLLLEPRPVLAAGGPALPALPPGQLRALRGGAALSLLAWGPGVEAALDAAARLAEDGLDAEVLDLRSLRPLDEAGIAARLHETGRAVLVDAPSLLPRVVQAAFLRLEAPPGLAGPETSSILAAARAALQY